MSELEYEDRLVHLIAADDTVRCLAVVTTNIVREASRRHELRPVGAAALGRTLTGTLLLGSSMKELDRLTVQISGNGPIGGITAEANARGDVRGYVRNPDADVPLNSEGKFDVRSLIGEGMFYVIRESGYEEGLYREPYRGSVPLVSGEIAEDFAFYLTKSEQIPSAVMLGVLATNDDFNRAIVKAAGGVMIQIMPGASDETITALEASIKAAPHITYLIRDGAAPLDLARAILGEIPFELLDDRPVRFACNCSYDRAVSMVGSFDPAELESMLAEDQGAVINCQFCNETYRLDEAVLRELLDRPE
ncbi:MAG: Hsp33 family molecular chaperone HslO [Pyrinomonadaceae bacterium]